MLVLIGPAGVQMLTGPEHNPHYRLPTDRTLRNGLLGKRRYVIKEHGLFDSRFITVLVQGVRNKKRDRYGVNCLIACQACRNEPWYSHPSPHMPYSESDAGKFTSRISASAAGSFKDQ